ncbi:MAG: 1-acyl-sn-glycerol-3-phosphate acyltransferase, partial [Alkalicoccus sp.]
LQKKDKKDADKFVHQKAERWARRLFRLAGGKAHVYGLENIPEDEPVLFVSNHQGNFDIPLLLHTAGRKIGFISKKEVKRIPLISSWMELLGCVFIDRKDRRQAVQMIREGADNLRTGNSLVIFPEGTRNKGETTGQFKKGSFKLAQLSRVAIVPVSISGSYKMMEANNGRMKPADVNITYGKPMRDHMENNLSLDRLAEQVQKEVEKNI